MLSLLVHGRLSEPNDRLAAVYEDYEAKGWFSSCSNSWLDNVSSTMFDDSMTCFDKGRAHRYGQRQRTYRLIFAFIQQEPLPLGLPASSPRHYRNTPRRHHRWHYTSTFQE